MIKKVIDSSKLEAIYYKLFKSRDPFSDAAHINMPIRTVLYPTSCYHLRDDQFDALKKTGAKRGRNEFYISQIEFGFHYSFCDMRHWHCINPIYTEYDSISIALHNSVYSPDGSWGFLISDADHALLACTQEFWNEFKKHYPSWKDDYKKFIDYWLGQDVKRREGWFDNFIAGLTVKA